MKNGIVIVGIVTTVLAVFVVSSAVALPIPEGKQAIVWLEPDPSSATPDEEMTVQLKVNTSVWLGGFADWIYFDQDCVDITEADWTGSPFNSETGFSNWGNYVIVGGMDPQFCEQTTGELLLVTLTLKGINPGTSQLYHHPDHVEMLDCSFEEVTTSWIHGNFTCTAPSETFTKNLVTGWNLISLPLQDADMTVETVIDDSLGGTYDALYSYNATTHSFELLDSGEDAMANGVGYFIHMTEEAEWEYDGTPYTTMNEGLSQGLNMVGALNCTKDVSDGLSSIAGSYNYVARWDANAQEFEIYNPAAPSVFNDFTTMERGEGYFISAKVADTLSESCS